MNISECCQVFKGVNVPLHVHVITATVQ